jgi:hypothetical protein
VGKSWRSLKRLFRNARAPILYVVLVVSGLGVFLFSIHFCFDSPDTTSRDPGSTGVKVNVQK